MTAFLLAQAGMPVTSGFVAKFGIVQAAVEAGDIPLSILSMSASVVAAYPYLRLVSRMWLDGTCRVDTEVGLGSRIATFLAIASLFVFGLWPDLIMTLFR